MEKYACKAITITLTGDYEKIYERFTKRNESSERHRGHVVNDSYPEKDQNREVMPISYEGFVDGIKSRGMVKEIVNCQERMV